MNQAQIIIEFLRFSEQLKTQLRDIKLPGWRMESVAEHSWQLTLLLLLVYPSLTNKVDLLKALKIALIHDLAEAETWDIPYIESHNYPQLKLQKVEQEKQVIEKIWKLLGVVGNEIIELYEEYEKRETFESKLVKALDCLEANYQSLSFWDIDWWHEWYFDIVLTKSDKHCIHEEILGQLNDEINRLTEIKMRKIWLDVDAIKRKNKK